MTNTRAPFRRSLLGAAAALTLLVSACGSDEAAPASIAPAAPSTASSMADPGTEGMEETMDQGTEGMTEPTGDMSMSMSMTPTTTAGGDTTELDETSTTWISTVCTGLAPVSDLSNMQMDSPEEAASALGELGSALTGTADELTQLEPPTFEGGAELADRITAAFKDLGASMTEASEAAAGGDTAALQEAVGSIMSSENVQQLGSIGTTPEIQAAVAEIPACQEAGMTQ